MHFWPEPDLFGIRKQYKQNHYAFVFWVCCYHPATPLLFLREKWLIASVCYPSLEKQRSNITTSWTVSLKSLVTGAIPYIRGIFVTGFHCTVPARPIWALQTNTTRKGNTAHCPPSPAALACLLHLQPALSWRKGFYFPGGGRDPRQVRWLQHWQSWFCLPGESPSCLPLSGAV